MSSANENTALLHDRHSRANGCCNGLQQQQQQQQTQQQHSHYILVSEKPLHEDYERILAVEVFSSALTLEELLPYVEDPWWQKLRRTLFCTFSFVFLLILFTACTLAYMQDGGHCAVSRVTTITTTISTTATTAGILTKA